MKEEEAESGEEIGFGFGLVEDDCADGSGSDDSGADGLSSDPSGNREGTGEVSRHTTGPIGIPNDTGPMSDTKTGTAYAVLDESMLRSPPRRRIKLPVVLFLLTCLSTFWVGSALWCPEQFLPNDWRLAIVTNWPSGLLYMVTVLGILFFHEMGHFLMTVRYRIPASFPYFIPIPFTLLGTMGAVIAMAGYRANRRQTFDIGIAGPLAGLALAVPVLWFGVQGLDLDRPGYGGVALDLPLFARLLIGWLQPAHANVDHIWISQVNALFMAGWVGLLITGLNMVPISQLDGGHVIYALFLGKAHWIARAFLICTLGYIIWAQAYMWTLMVVLVTLIGTDHPPTANDQMPLGRGRYLLGLASLVIPLFCFPPRGFMHLFD